MSTATLLQLSVHLTGVSDELADDVTLFVLGSEFASSALTSLDGVADAWFEIGRPAHFGGTAELNRTPLCKRRFRVSDSWRKAFQGDRGDPVPEDVKEEIQRALGSARLVKWVTK